MQSDNKMFEDVTRMMNGLAGTFAGFGREAQESGRERMKAWLGGLDCGGRAEFAGVTPRGAAARDEVEALRAELARLHAAPPPAPRATPDPEQAKRAG